MQHTGYFIGQEIPLEQSRPIQTGDSVPSWFVFQTPPQKEVSAKAWLERRGVEPCVVEPVALAARTLVIIGVLGNGVDEPPASLAGDVGADGLALEELKNLLHLRVDVGDRVFGHLEHPIEHFLGLGAVDLNLGDGIEGVSESTPLGTAKAELLMHRLGVEVAEVRDRHPADVVLERLLQGVVAHDSDRGELSQRRECQIVGRGEEQVAVDVVGAQHLVRVTRLGQRPYPLAVLEAAGRLDGHAVGADQVTEELEHVFRLHRLIAVGNDGERGVVSVAGQDELVFEGLES